MFGSMLFLGLFHLLTHLIYRTEGAVYLFFGLCIICMAMGNAVRSTFPLYDLFPDFPYLLVKRLQFICYFLAGLFFLQTPVSLQGRAYTLFQRVAGILILLLVGALSFFRFTYIFFKATQNERSKSVSFGYMLLYL